MMTRDTLGEGDDDAFIDSSPAAVRSQLRSGETNSTEAFGTAIEALHAAVHFDQTPDDGEAGAGSFTNSPRGEPTWRKLSEMTS
jgi:hypothetical protein